MSNNINISEPEVRGSNKAPDFQSAVIRARKSGCNDALEVAEAIYDWHMDASRSVQISTLHYAVTRIWATTEGKLPAANQRKAKAETIDAKVRAELDKKWLDVIIPMTGAQVRAAKLLPDAMAALVGDAQRVGEVFTAQQLKATSKAQ